MIIYFQGARQSERCRRFGSRLRNGKNPAYSYLCSLVAFFDDRALTDEQTALLDIYFKCTGLLLYEI